MTTGPEMWGALWRAERQNARFFKWLSAAALLAGVGIGLLIGSFWA